MTKKLILTLCIILLGICSNHAQHRGHSPGELYLSKLWYWDGSSYHYLLLYTDNYGRNFNLQYVYQTETDGVPLHNLYADTQPGVVYNLATHSSFPIEQRGLYISEDYGINWEFLRPPFSTGEIISTGNLENEIFSRAQGILSKSENKGASWSHIQDSVFGNIEVGTQAEEIYNRRWDGGYGLTPISLTIGFSANDGLDFETWEVDTIVSGTRVSGYGPEISRGMDPGELYLISWWHGADFKIFHSTDHGHSFIQQYQQSALGIYSYDGYRFTAGREPGEFYIIVRSLDGVTNRVTIYHSRDYAQTFTEYAHNVLPDYTGDPVHIIYTIATRVNTEEGGTTQGEGKFHEGELVELTAISNPGYVFTHWSENDTLVTTDSVYSFTAMDTRTLKANFELETGTGLTAQNAGVAIYPNPANQHLTVSIETHLLHNSNTQIEIINLYGQQVLQQTLLQDKTTLDTSQIPAGSYIYRLTDGGKLFATGKIIIH